MQYQRVLSTLALVAGGAFLIASALVAAPAPGSAQSGGLGRVPVEIAGCEFHYTHPRMVDTIDFLRVTYTNHWKAPATSLTIRYAYDAATGSRTTGTLEDRGSFAPEVEITHLFTPYIAEREKIGRHNVQCSLVAATFADGYSWYPGAKGIVTPPPPTPTPTPTPEPPTP